MSKTWFVTIDNYRGNYDTATIENSTVCKRTESSFYHLELDGGIIISFDKPIFKIENEDDL